MLSAKQPYQYHTVDEEMQKGPFSFSFHLSNSMQYCESIGSQKVSQAEKHGREYENVERGMPSQIQPEPLGAYVGSSI